MHLSGEQQGKGPGRTAPPWLPVLGLMEIGLVSRLSSHAGKVVLKIFQARLQQYMNQELPDLQTGFRKGRRRRDQIANIHWIVEKASEFQKKSISASLTLLKPVIVWITANCGKILRDGNTTPLYLPPKRPVCRSRINC